MKIEKNQKSSCLVHGSYDVIICFLLGWLMALLPVRDDGLEMNYQTCMQITTATIATATARHFTSHIRNFFVTVFNHRQIV